MKNLYIAVLAMCSVMFVNSSFAGEYDFRKTTWGMTMEQVKVSETLKNTEEYENILVYKTTVASKSVYVVYIFVNNQLTRTKYALNERHSNGNEYIHDYNDFVDVLTKKYGEPKSDNTYWSDDLYKDDVSNWGMAICTGRLSYYTVWETQNTTIIAALHGDNYETTCVVEYNSKSLKKMVDEVKEKKAMEDF